MHFLLPYLLVVPMGAFIQFAAEKRLFLRLMALENGWRIQVNVS